MADPRRWDRATMMAVAVATLAVVSVFAVTRWPRPTPTLAGRPECPHDWTNVYDSTVYFQGGVHLEPLVNGQFSVSAQYTNIPEFHDCQRLIVSNDLGGTKYSQLAAIFLSAAVISGSQSLDLPELPTGGGGAPTIGSLTQNAINVLGQPMQEALGGARAYVEVVSEGRYGILGINVGFNCLYAGFPQAPLRALMVSFGTTEVDCAKVPYSATMQGTELVLMPGPRTEPAGDVPAVTRWDWDDRAGIHLIGMPCGKKWCDVGPLLSHPSQARGGAGDPRQKRVKGWYDEQYLADYVAGKPVTTKIVGTVFPVENLGTINQDVANYARKWVHVGYATINQPSTTYLDKYGFRDGDASGSLDALNKLYLCNGSFTDCTVNATLSNDPDHLQNLCQSGWWAKSQQGTNTEKYFCVAFRKHENMTIPPVTRWRWRANDETIWVACPFGCCEMDSYEK